MTPQEKANQLLSLHSITILSEEDIIKLNYYTNLRPLWAIDNIRKSNKI